MLRLFVTFLRVLRLVDFFLLFFYNFMKPIHSLDNLLLFHNRLRIVQFLGFIVLIILVGRQLTVSVLVNILLVDLFCKYFRLGLLLKIYEILGQLPLVLPQLDLLFYLSNGRESYGLVLTRANLTKGKNWARVNHQV